MKKIFKKILIISMGTFSLTSFALADLFNPATPMSDNPSALSIEMMCQQITLQCKTNQISASDCMKKMQDCDAAMAQVHQQQLNPQNLNNPPQNNNAGAQQPASNAAPNSETNPHPAWHFGN